MDPIGYIHAMDAMRSRMNSALPDAPVRPDRPARRRPTCPGPVRRGAAGTLRRLADRLEPVIP